MPGKASKVAGVLRILKSLLPHGAVRKNVVQGLGNYVFRPAITCFTYYGVLCALWGPWVQCMPGKCAGGLRRYNNSGKTVVELMLCQSRKGHFMNASADTQRNEVDTFLHSHAIRIVATEGGDTTDALAHHS